MTKQEKQVLQFNRRYSIGSPVQYFPVRRETSDGEIRGDFGAIDTKTRSEAFVLGGHTAVVFVEGISGCVAVSNIEAPVAVG